jgi:hypothetical protein
MSLSIDNVFSSLYSSTNTLCEEDRMHVFVNIVDSLSKYVSFDLITISLSKLGIILDENGMIFLPQIR